jgi:hypothetical protein
VFDALVGAARAIVGAVVVVVVDRSGVIVVAATHIGGTRELSHPVFHIVFAGAAQEQRGRDSSNRVQTHKFEAYRDVDELDNHAKQEF